MSKDCERCDGGWVVDEAGDGSGVVGRCPCKSRRASVSDALALAGVPERERTFTPEAMTRPQKAVAGRAAAAVDRGDAVLLVGPVGRGKTGLAVCEVIRALRAGRSARWCNVGDWLRELRAQFDAPPETRRAEALMLRELLEPDLLVVDDLGAEHLTDWTRSMVHALIDGRDSSGRPYIATTNLPLAPARPGDASIATVYGDRVASRLSRCVRLSMSAEVPDLRDRRLAGGAR